MFGSTYIIPLLEGSCLYLSTFSAIFCLAFIEFSRFDPHYSCGKFEIFIFLGDYLGDLAYPQKTLEYLDGIKKKYPCIFIRGNKEDYWINHKNGKHRDWVWEAGRSGSGMLAYVYNHLTLEQIKNFEKMPISMTMRYQGFPDFVIFHGSPWKTNESMREDYDYIDELTKRLETELTICAHFHIQSNIHETESWSSILVLWAFRSGVMGRRSL